MRTICEPQVAAERRRASLQEVSSHFVLGRLGKDFFSIVRSFVRSSRSREMLLRKASFLLEVPKNLVLFARSKYFDISSSRLPMIWSNLKN